MCRKGSAIIIAFFLMAAASGAAFAIARLFNLDSSSTAIHNDSVVAYYAAESGIEESFLRYRFDRQSQVPGDATTEKVNRSNLNNMNVSENILPNSAITDAYKTSSVYDLNMSYKKHFYGDDINNDGVLTVDDMLLPGYGIDNNQYIIPRDESVKIDITDAIAGGTINDLKLMVILSNYGGSPDFTSRDDAFIEAKIIAPNSETNPETDYEFKKILVTRDRSSEFADQSQIIMINGNLATADDYYYRDDIVDLIVGHSLSYVDNNNRAYLYLKPIGCDAKIGISLKFNNFYIAAPFSTIKSKGYYNGVTHTLEAKIDRQSGTIYDLFDFVNYEFGP